MHLLEQFIDSLIVSYDLPEWSFIFLFALLIATAIAVVYFIISFIFYGIRSRMSIRFLENGEKATARYVSSRSEYKQKRKKHPDYRKEQYHFVTYEFKAGSDETIQIEEMTKSLHLRDNFRKQPAFEVYYMPYNPRRHKKAAEMNDIQKFKMVPKNTFKIFIMTVLVVLIIMVIGIFTKN